MVYRIELWRWFQRRFNAAYNNYLTWHGFDTVKFDNEVIQSGDACALDVCRERFGPIAANFIKAAASWTPDVVPSKESIIELDDSKPEEAAEIKVMGLG